MGTQSTHSGVGRAGVLQAAIEVMTETNGTGFTLAAVAQRAGVSKPGVLHHFPSMDALNGAVAEYIVDEWAAAMSKRLEVPVNEATPLERTEAFVVTVCSGDLKSPFFAIYANAAHWPFIQQIWRERFGTWFAALDDLDPETRRALLLARYAAIGMWSEEASGRSPRDAEERAALRDSILTNLRAASSLPSETPG